LCLRFGTPHTRIRTSSGLSESRTKIGDVPKAPVPKLAALLLSAASLNLQKNFAWNRVESHQLPNLCAMLARGPS